MGRRCERGCERPVQSRKTRKSAAHNKSPKGRQIKGGSEPHGLAIEDSIPQSLHCPRQGGPRRAKKQLGTKETVLEKGTPSDVRQKRAKGGGPLIWGDQKFPQGGKSAKKRRRGGKTEKRCRPDKAKGERRVWFAAIDSLPKPCLNYKGELSRKETFGKGGGTKSKCRL